MRSVILAVGCLVLGTPAWADICIQNSREVAQAGARLIQPRGDVVQFCSPCGDTKAAPMQVGTVKVGQEDVSDESSFEVIVNGNAIDLAYTYVCKAGEGGRHCADVGVAAKCTSDPDVPAFLPDSALAQ